eukprot:CAMPEP_0119132770 /NCGR_PEP_ID=MMETSP1310-20130426/12275_1 /TAXON_ID=464262 /ORGANISM="Genus nov. species nov., Strain RCC2339" /LENGTH=695 /DNA_ID=CAMNT_0007123423 /DNA_START=60 /DNA_END=2147 /DNA_ORIENTATION=-
MKVFVLVLLGLTAVLVHGQSDCAGEGVGTVQSKLDGRRTSCWTGWCAAGNAVADALRYAGQSSALEQKPEIAFYNGGGIRASFDEGFMTRLRASHILPFDGGLPFSADSNTVAMSLTGKQILELLEHGLQAAPCIANGHRQDGGRGRFLQVSSNFAYHWACGDEPTLLSATLNGEALVEGETYRIITSQFLANGGDGFPWFECGSDKEILSGTLVDNLLAYVNSLPSGVLTPTPVRITSDVPCSTGCPSDLVMGRTRLFVSGDRRECRRQDCDVGRFYTDAVMARAASLPRPVDVVLVQGGALRASLGASSPEVTYANIEAVDLFRNELVTMTMTGAELLAVFEHSAGWYTGDCDDLLVGPFLQISGARFSYNCQGDTGARVLSAAVGDFPLDRDTEYTVLTTTYLAGGGDGYDFSAASCPITLSDDGVVAQEEYLADNVITSSLLQPEQRVIRAGTCEYDCDDVVVADFNTFGGPFLGEGGACKRTECGVGDLVATFMLRYGVRFGAVAAVQNSGGLAHTIGGEATFADVAAAVPFDDPLALVEVTGNGLLGALALGVSRAEECHGQFLQVDGLTYEYDCSQESEITSRIVSAALGEIGNGTIYPEATYRLITNSFLAQGGDFYTVFQGAEVNVLLDHTLHTLIQVSSAGDPDRVTQGGRIFVDVECQEECDLSSSSRLVAGLLPILAALLLVF